MKYFGTPSSAVQHSCGRTGKPLLPLGSAPDKFSCIFFSIRLLFHCSLTLIIIITRTWVLVPVAVLDWHQIFFHVFERITEFDVLQHYTYTKGRVHTHFIKFVHLHSSIHTFFEWVGRKMFWSLLGYIVAKACTSPRNSTWFTRLFLLMRGWGLGMRLM